MNFTREYTADALESEEMDNEVSVTATLPSGSSFTVTITPEQAGEIVMFHDIVANMPEPSTISRLPEIVLAMACLSIDEANRDFWRPDDRTVTIDANTVTVAVRDASGSIEIPFDYPDILAYAVEAGVAAPTTMSNQRRAMQTRPLVEIYRNMSRMGADEDVQTIASDLIGDILHAVREAEGDAAALTAHRSGLAHHLSEVWDGDEAEPDLDFSICIQADAPRAGIEIETSTGERRPMIEVNETFLEEYRAGASGGMKP